MSKKLLFNNLKAKANCPCCGSVEDECICTTLAELGVSELELDFAIAGKYAGITFSGGTASRTDYGYTWVSMENNGLDSSKFTLFRDKMTELGRTRANDGGTDYYTYYNSNVYVTFIYWNYTLYGSPNITRLNKLMTFTDEQLEHLNKYGKCVIPCECCGEVGTNCTCTTIEADDRLVDWAIVGKYIGATSSNVDWDTSKGSNYNMGGDIGKVKMYQLYNYSSYSSSVITKFEEKMNQLGHYACSPSKGTCDYYIQSSSGYGGFMRFCWNYTLYGTPNTTLLKQLLSLTEEQLLQIKMYGKYC